MLTIKRGDSMSQTINTTYDYAKSFIKDKDKAITNFTMNALNKLQQMFIYGGLPDTIPQEELEKLLLENGNAFITNVNGDLYALSGSVGGECDEYNRPRFYTVANPALNISKNYEIGVDGVLIKNDFKMTGVLPLVLKYGALMVDSDISLNSTAILSRIQMLISAPDDKTKASADLFLQKINDGEFSIIGETAFFDGVKLQSAPTGTSQYITQFIELTQYYKASFLNEIGLNANYNMKRERLTDNEIALNIDAILPFADNMHSERKRAIEEVNKMFETEIVVDYNSAWKTTHEESDKETAKADTNIEIIGETETGEKIPVVEDDTKIETETKQEETETEQEETETEQEETETEQEETETEQEETKPEEEEKEENEKN